jgi:hypothetical protein
MEINLTMTVKPGIDSFLKSIYLSFLHEYSTSMRNDYVL